MQEIQNMFTNKTTHHIWLVSPLDSMVQSTMFHLEHLLIACHRTHVALCRFKHYNWLRLVLFVRFSELNFVHYSLLFGSFHELPLLISDEGFVEWQTETWDAFVATYFEPHFQTHVWVRIFRFGHEFEWNLLESTLNNEFWGKYFLNKPGPKKARPYQEIWCKKSQTRSTVLFCHGSFW